MGKSFEGCRKDKGGPEHIGEGVDFAGLKRGHKDTPHHKTQQPSQPPHFNEEKRLACVGFSQPAGKGRGDAVAGGQGDSEKRLAVLFGGGELLGRRGKGLGCVVVVLMWGGGATPER